MFLFDANFLIALGDADHVHHEKAQAFFAIKKQDGWATCPLTENATSMPKGKPPDAKVYRENLQATLTDL
jgi:predicted nucleic acid-binding protein